jgi:hypothetical protein
MTMTMATAFDGIVVAVEMTWERSTKTTMMR